MAFPLWLVGVALAVIASITSNLGLNIQKRCHLHNEKIISEKAEKKLEQQRQQRKLARELLKQQQEEEDNALDAESSSFNLNGHISSNGKLNGNYHEISTTIVDSTSSSTHSVSDSPPLDDPAAIKLLRRNNPTLAVNGNGTVNGNGNHNDSSQIIHGQRSRNSSISSMSGETLLLVQQKLEQAEPKINYTKQKLWQFGMFLVISGSFFDFAALAFTDQSIVAPLGSLTLVSNAIFAPLLLKEKVSRKIVICTIIIVAGSAIAVTFASHSDTVITVEEMFQLFINYRFVVYSCATFGSIFFMRVLIWRYGKLRKSNARSPEYEKVQAIHRFSYAACAGIMGAQSVLFAKCTAQLLVSTIAGQGMMFTQPGTYGVLLGLGVTIFYQVRWLNSGLRLFPALYIVPIFQSFWILISVLSGMVFFQEYQGLFEHTVNLVMFPIGLIMTLSGVFLLSRKGASKAPDAPATNQNALNSPLLDEIGDEEQGYEEYSENGLEDGEEFDDNSEFYDEEESQNRSRHVTFASPSSLERITEFGNTPDGANSLAPISNLTPAWQNQANRNSEEQERPELATKLPGEEAKARLSVIKPSNINVGRNRSPSPAPKPSSGNSTPNLGHSRRHSGSKGALQADLSEEILMSFAPLALSALWLPTGIDDADLMSKSPLAQYPAINSANSGHPTATIIPGKRPRSSTQANYRPPIYKGRGSTNMSGPNQHHRTNSAAINGGETISPEKTSTAVNSAGNSATYSPQSSQPIDIQVSADPSNQV
jgi:uncharacterized membrane protein